MSRNCEYCDDTGDVHSIDGEWRGKCTSCAVSIENEFKNFHKNLCKRFGYPHDDIDWRRDQVSLEEFIAAKIDKPSINAKGSLEHFTEYFVRNYPGPNTIIGDPLWHAPKIFRAAQYAIKSAMSAESREDTK